jgi:photosystem II stability/assembly factor-like uncharacterized protein
MLMLLLLKTGDSAPWWSVETSGLDTNLRGVSVKYNRRSAGRTYYQIWASGSNGVILHSTNNGETWKQLAVAGGGDLDFRDIEGFEQDEDTAYVMSSGDGDKSRIYKTIDGGRNWKLQYSDKRPGFFLDSLACDSKTHCLALSDPVDGKFLVLSTDDGEHWKELPPGKMPAALPKEGAFAASGTAIALCDHGNVYFGTGGAAAARVFHSNDRGQSWTVAETPIASGNASSGVFSIACGGFLVVAVGGDYKEPAAAKRVAAFSDDSGETWHLAEQQPGGFRSAVSQFSGGDFATVGTNGTDVSRQELDHMHWQHTDYLNVNAASFAGSEGWAVGPKGMIARFKTHWFYEIKNIAPAGQPTPGP